MKNLLTLFIIFLSFSCTRELEFKNDYNFQFEGNLIELNNTASINSDLSIKLKISDLGLSSNAFQINYSSDNSGVMKFESNNEMIPFNTYINVSHNEDIILNYTSDVIGEQILTINCKDLSGTIKTLIFQIEFLEPQFDLYQISNLSSTENNNAIHEVFINNENISNDTYEMKYEILSMNWVQEPATTFTEPTFYVGDNIQSSITTLQSNTYNNINNSIITLPNNEKKIKIKLANAGYSQFQIKITIKNSFGIEKILSFTHNGTLPNFNIVDFISRYKRQTWVPLGGSNLTYIYFSVCINAPSISGASLQSVKILTRSIDETTFTVRHVGGMPNGNSYSYSKSYVFPNNGSNSFDVIRTILTYSNGNTYWVDKGVNYDVNAPIYYGSGFAVSPCM
ncbi:MAG: hypothetical protein HC854_04075 [Flavobacterium sp.]|nr:hypothetical protein [Flavobacterium sp.]